MTWYRAGTVAVTLNSKIVTGTNSSWSTVSGGALVGSGFRGPDGRMYEIAAVGGDTSLTLVENYFGPTATGQNYAIMPALGLAADLAAALALLLQKTGGTVDSATTLGKQLLAAPDPGTGRTLLNAVNKAGDTMSGGLAAASLSAPGASAFAFATSGLFMSGSYRNTYGIDLSSVGGNLQVTGHHLPGVEAFVRTTVFSSTFEMTNNGVGRSAGGWTSTSDKRVKENLQVIDRPLERLRHLTGYTYDRTDMKSMAGVAPRKAGHLAQDALRVLPETVAVPANYDAERDEGDLLSMHHDGVAALHTECIKALEHELAELRKQLPASR